MKENEREAKENETEAKWIDCLGPNLPTVLFYLCDEAQERLATEDPDFEKADSDQLLDAIVDKLGVVNVASTLYVDAILGIELKIQLNQEPDLRKIHVYVASFDERYGVGTGESAIKKAKEAWLQAHVAKNPRLCDVVMRTILVFFTLLASMVFAETEIVDYHTEVVDGIEWTYHVEDGAAIIGGTNCPNGVYSTTTAAAIPTATVGRVVTPLCLGGLPVKGLGGSAFSRCPQLTSVVISEGITNISEYAFYDSTKIESVSLPNSITSIGRYAFSYTALQEITLPSAMKSLGVHAFSSCTNLVFADLTSAVTVIPSGAFMDCMQLKTVILPLKVEDIGHFAFACKGKRPPVANIRLPASIKSICESAFSEYSYYSSNTTDKYYYYGRGISAPLFLGDCPTIYKPETSYRAYRDYYYDGSFGIWSSSVYPVYIVEGATGWPEPSTLHHYVLVSRWEGTYLEIGAAKVSIEPEVSVSRQMSENVSLLCTNSTATIYYTLDGTEPTTNETDTCFVYREPFELDTDTTIKALAYVPSYKFTVVETKDLRFKANQPTVAVDGQQQFFHSDSLVEIVCPEEPNVKIYYTLNGEEPTTESARFTAPFAISQTTTVKALVVRENGVASDVETIELERLWLTNETPVVEAESASFATSSQTVTLSCATDGAAIYYTIDGSEPSASNGRLYKCPFDVYQTTTVKAVAVKDDWKDSEVAVATFTKENALGPALNLLEMLPDNDKAHPWTVVTDVTHDGVSAVKSGEIEDDESTTLKVVIYGAGELSFWWRTSCEPSIDGEWYDYATFYDGSTAVANLAGATDWQRVVRTVEGTGKHTFKWTYQKDGSGSTVPDGVWLDQVQWLPKTDDWYSDHTLTTETPVPYAWLDKFGLGRASDFETAAKAKSGKHDGAGRALTVEEEYVAGTDPTNAASRLETRIELKDGAPVVTWTPDLNEGGAKALRTYKVWGKETLDASEWEYPTNALHRFFRVTVEMP